MKNYNDILEEILSISLRLRPVSFLLSHYSSSYGQEMSEEESMRALGDFLAIEIERLKQVHQDMEELWQIE